MALHLLQDAATLLTLPAVRPADADQANREDNAYLALSDLHATFISAKQGKKAMHPLAAPKLLFYASNLGRIPRKQALAQVDLLIAKLEAEQAESSALQESAKVAKKPPLRGVKLIEEV